MPFPWKGVPPPPQQRRRMRRPEQNFQKALVDTLRLIMPKDAFLYAVPNGGWRSKAEAKIMQGQGVVAGVPDLAFIWRGSTLFMELKADAGKATTRQTEVHEAIVRAGAPVAVIRTLPEAISFLEAHRVPLLTIKGGA